MKRIFSILFAISLSVATYAQTNLTTAVDFTVTDTQGNVHTLFDYLDAGKIVVLDFFFNS